MAPARTRCLPSILVGKRLGQGQHSECHVCLSRHEQKNCGRVIITHIHATNVACGLRRLPTELYISVNFGGIVTKTSNKTISTGKDAVEWDEEIQLPTNPSSAISFKVYVSSKLEQRIGSGVLLRQFKTSVGEILDHDKELEPARFLTARHEHGSSSPSLRIVAEQRNCHGPECLKPQLHSDVKTELKELIGKVHNTLLRYHRYINPIDLNQAIAYYGLARYRCHEDNPMFSTATLSLANAMFIDCQVNNYDISLDVPIKLYGNALRHVPVGHSDYVKTILQLCLALLARFQRRGDKSDQRQVRGLLARLMKPFPGDSHLYRVRRCAPLTAKESVSSQVKDSGVLHRKSGDDADWIHREKDILRTLSQRDPRRPVVLARLGSLLYHRFQKNGDLADINEAISMLEQAMQLVPNSDPEKPSILNVLGLSLQYRFSRLGNTADIKRSISTLEEGLGLTSNGHSSKQSLLNSLGNSLLRRNEYIGDFADITRAVSMHEEVVDLTSRDHPDRPRVLSDLANSLSCRFARLGNITDVTKSVSIIEEAIRLTPDGHRDKPALLSNLGVSLCCRFERLGDVEDITKSVSIFEEAVRLTPHDHLDRRSHLSNLGRSLFGRFERLGGIEDLTKSILMKEAALCLTPDDHPDKSRLLGNLGNSLARRFERLWELADITKSVSMLQEAIRITPDDHLDKPSMFSNLGSSFSLRFRHSSDVADITKSISMEEAAVCLTSDDHPDKSRLLSNLGNSLLSRFEHSGDIADLTKSISMNEKAVRLTPNGHPGKPSRLGNLGSSLLNRFERLGDVTDIMKSTSIFEEANCLIPEGHPEKPQMLINLGSSLSRRFDHLGDIADIMKSISMMEQAVCLTPDSHADKPNRLGHLGNSLCRRFRVFGDIADVTKSVSMLEEAILHVPDGHRDKLSWLNNLGNALFRRFECLGDVADITKSIEAIEWAIRLTPVGHAHNPILLSSLGNSLSRRFECTGDIADITKSVSINEEATRLIPDGHPGKPGWLNNLGASLSIRFERLGDSADISKSIGIIEEAIRLTPDGHPNKPSQWHNLGNSFMTRFNRFHTSSDLFSATLRFSIAARCSTGPISSRFIAARSWISAARIEGNSHTLLDAYTVALSILPQLAWMGLPLTERHRVLGDAADLARGAAAAALDASFPEMAVEWLEQGRSIVWNQLLQLRTPVDLLRVVHLSLADELEQISKALESAGSRNPSVLHDQNRIPGPNSRSLEDEVQKYHTLALRREKLLSDIRSLSGFDHFLLPSTIEQLSSKATSGPIIYLNASTERCDALIVMAEPEKKVIPVPLSDLGYHHIEGMRRILLNRDYSFISRDDILLLTSPIQRSAIEGWDREGEPGEFEGRIPFDRFQLVLGFLWRTVVIPILDALGISTLSPPSTIEEMRHIYWCPTGPFAFLPVHASGLYGTWHAPEANLLNFAISSYIPTIGALPPSARKHASGHPSKICLVTVPQPSSDGQSKLPNTRVEINHIQALAAESRFVTLQNSDGTVEDAMQKMSNADWVHFACHGVQDPTHPLDSGLCLADCRRLKLSDVIKLSRPQGGLAFLSACQTAKGDENLSEESVHLAAGMLLAGYGGVIATMWSIMDNDAPKVARDVYSHLFRDGKVPDTTEAAEALHRAVVHLRDVDKVPFSSWVPFIHVGR